MQIRVYCMLKRQKNSIRISKYNNTITIKSSKKTFGPQPFLALKVNNKYYHDNLDIIEPFYKWNYTFDENNFSLDKIEDTFFGKIFLRYSTPFGFICYLASHIVIPLSFWLHNLLVSLLGLIILVCGLIKIK